MKTISLIFTLLLFSYFSLAQDYVLDKKHKLSYQEFMNLYGTDDTSKAIIEIYFDKRDYSATGQISFLPISSIVAVIVPPLGISLMAISSPLFVNGLLISNKYSRKKLLKALNNYQNDSILSNRNKKMVVKQLIAQQENYNYDLLEARHHSSE